MAYSESAEKVQSVKFAEAHIQQIQMLMIANTLVNQDFQAFSTVSVVVYTSAELSHTSRYVLLYHGIYASLPSEY